MFVYADSKFETPLTSFDDVGDSIFLPDGSEFSVTKNEQCRTLTLENKNTNFNFILNCSHESNEWFCGANNPEFHKEFYKTNRYRTNITRIKGKQPPNFYSDSECTNPELFNDFSKVPSTVYGRIDGICTPAGMVDHERKRVLNMEVYFEQDQLARLEYDGDRNGT